MGPPLSKARKAKAHFYRMKAGESSSDLVQCHPTPGPSNVDKVSGVVEAEVSPSKKNRGFSNRFLRNKPVVTREELDEGLESCNEGVRAALKLYMLISSGKFTDLKIIGTMTIDDDLFQVLDCDDPHLKACATAYYEVLSGGTSLSDPKLNKVCKRFRDALENYNAKLRAQLEHLQKDISHGHSLLHKLHGCEDVQ